MGGVILWRPVYYIVLYLYSSIKNTPSHFLRIKKLLRGCCNEKLLRGLFRKLLRSFGTEHQTTQRALHKRKIARETATQHIETHISARQPGKYKTLGWSKTLVAPKPIRLILAKQRHACVFGENCSQSDQTGKYFSEYTLHVL